MSEADSASNDTLAEQRLSLASLEACEEKIRSLRDEECELEVEDMAAQAALHSAANRVQPTIDTALAVRIGGSLEQRRELEETLHETGARGGRRPAAGTRYVDQLRAGRAALESWLDASKQETRGGVSAAAKAALLIASIATIWAAIVIHPAFLLLLVAVVGPVSFALGRGQDADWRRVGARRRYETSGLAEMLNWDEDSVRARCEELCSLLEAPNRDGARANAEVSEREPVEAGDVAARIADVNARLSSDLAAAGLSAGDLRGETGEWLRLAARADRSHRSLERVKDERRRLRADAAALRDGLARYLHSRGAKPTEQLDTAAAIAERLERLSDSD